MGNPSSDRFPRRFRNLELNGPLRLLLHYDRSCGNGLAVANIAHPELNEVTGAKFAVDGQIEQSQFAIPNG